MNTEFIHLNRFFEIVINVVYKLGERIMSCYVYIQVISWWVSYPRNGVSVTFFPLNDLLS